MAVKWAANQLELKVLACRRARDGHTPITWSTSYQADRELELQRLNDELAEYDRRVHAGRTGRWFPLYSGRRFWPESPQPGDIHIEDIAHALARINRFNGHTIVSYSVAQHSVLCSEIVPAQAQLYALLHDAAEAYLGDVISPVKRLLGNFEALEERIMAAVAQRFGFSRSGGVAEMVKRADLVMLATEIRDLTSSGVRYNSPSELPLERRIEECWGPEEAERRFLGRFYLLAGGAGDPTTVSGLRSAAAAAAG